jgi:hypothetical protein
LCELVNLRFDFFKGQQFLFHLRSGYSL